MEKTDFSFDFCFLLSFLRQTCGKNDIGNDEGSEKNKIRKLISSLNHLFLYIVMHNVTKYGLNDFHSTDQTSIFNCCTTCILSKSIYDANKTFNSKLHYGTCFKLSEDKNS